MTIDERIQALTMNLELAFRDIEGQRGAGMEASEKTDKRIDALTRLIEIDAENIRSLARIAEAHERRLDRIDGGAA